MSEAIDFIVKLTEPPTGLKVLLSMSISDLISFNKKQIYLIGNKGFLNIFARSSNELFIELKLTSSNA